MEKRFYVIMCLPAILLVFVFMGYLLCHCFYLSFRAYSPLEGIDRFIGFGNYTRILKDKVFVEAILRNIVYALLVVGANLLLGMGMAILINKGFKGEKIVRMILIMPMVCMPTVAGAVWVMVYNQEFGVVNHFLSLLGLERQMFLGLSKYAFYAVILTDIWGWTPFMFLILLTGLQSLPREPFEAARIDGASSWRTFWCITLPLLKPVTAIAIIVKLIDTFRTFDYIWVMTSGGPGNSSQIISTVTYRIAFQHFRYGLGSAMSIIALLFGLLLFILFVKVRGK